MMTPMNEMQSSGSSDAPPEPAKKKKKKKGPPPVIAIRESWCKGCCLCVEYCKPNAIEMNGTVVVVADAELCTRCMQCELICPDFAIEIDPVDGGEDR